jgi:hypothetical protein
VRDAVVLRVDLRDRVAPARLVLVEALAVGKTTFAEQLVA